MRLACIAILSAGLFAADMSWRDELAKWRANYEAELKAPDGWLSVAGLFWLHEGSNAIELPDRTVSIVFRNGVASLNGKVLKKDTPFGVGSVTIAIIERGGKTGVRLRDPNAATRQHFTGCRWFSPDEKWRIRAKWAAYPEPKKIPITNVLGMTQDEPSPGYAEFTVGGRTVRLDPVTEEDHLFFIFRDLTSGKSTYGAGRFLYAAMPKSGAVELDFNKAENPPCAFTAFATCPLPPRQNSLALAIEAGEKNYH